MRILTRLLLLLVGTLVAAVAVLCMPFTAAAAAIPIEPVTPIGPDSGADSLFSLDPFLVTMILGTLIPALISLVTTASTAAWIKKALTLALSAVAGVITAGMIDGGDGSTWIGVDALKSAGLAFITSMAAYFGLLRNSETERKLQAIGPADPPAE